jgi:bacillithiol biosynthesis deacetylase BshB1
MPCDLLVFAPHPDDAEIHCGATIAAHVRQGGTVVMVDATRGELASRGTPEIRSQEAQQAAHILGVSTRENLGLKDGEIPHSDAHARVLVVDAIRRHRPAVVLCINAHARHPDHQALADLVHGAVKAAALHRLATPSGEPAHQLARLFFYEAELPITASFLVPATEADWQIKRAAIQCYDSQVSPTRPHEPVTSIGQPGFLSWIESRGRTWGHLAGAPYAEAFVAPEAPRIRDLRSV